jgi:predicted DNA-binding transcriptional regulator AlpA
VRRTSRTINAEDTRATNPCGRKGIGVTSYQNNRLAGDDRASENIRPARRILNVEEAAKCLGLSVSTLNKLRISGAGPRYVQLTSRKVGYDPYDLDLWVAGRKRSSTSELGVF